MIINYNTDEEKMLGDIFLFCWYLFSITVSVPHHFCSVIHVIFIFFRYNILTQSVIYISFIYHLFKNQQPEWKRFVTQKREYKKHNRSKELSHFQSQTFPHLDRLD